MFIIQKKCFNLKRPKSKGLLRNISWNSINGDVSLENGMPTVC